MGAHNFWHNFTHGFMHGMFGNSPFFGCWGSFSPIWGNPFMYSGGFGPCFNPFGWNSSLFIAPNVMNNGFYPLMADIQPPGGNFNIDFNSLFPTDNIWDSYNKQMQVMQIPTDAFVSSAKQPQSTPDSTAPQSAQIIKSSVNVGDDTNLQNAKLTDKFTGSAEQLNKMLNRKDGVLKNKGQVFLNAQERYGINAAILAAICINESAYGTSNLARTKNNVGGVSQGSGFKSYSSVDECIMDMARFLKSGYVDKGLVTISQVGKKYCPVGDPRDTNGLNAGWGSTVASITKKIEAFA